MLSLPPGGARPGLSSGRGPGSLLEDALPLGPTAAHGPQEKSPHLSAWIAGTTSALRSAHRVSWALPAAALGKHQPRPCQQYHDFSPGTPCRLCCLHPWAQGQGRGTRRGHSTPSCCCFPAAQSSSAEDAEPQIQPGRAQAAGWGRCCRALLGLTGGQDQRHPLGSSRIWVPNIQLHHQRSCCHLEQPRAGLEESGGKGSGKRPYRNEQLEWETDEKPLLTNKEPDKRQGSLKGLTKV